MEEVFKKLSPLILLFLERFDADVIRKPVGSTERDPTTLDPACHNTNMSLNRPSGAEQYVAPPPERGSEDKCRNEVVSPSSEFAF